MKAISLSLAAISGAGFLFHNQLQTLVHRGMPGSAQHHQAPAGVYYLRTAYDFPTSGGTARWAAGQELRTTEDTLATNGMVTLTDGRNTATVSETAVTQDMDDAAALRQLEASNQNTARQQTVSQPPAAVAAPGQDRLVAGQFHGTSLDAPAVRTNLPENIVSTAAAPVVYSSSYYSNNTVVVGQAPRAVVRREVIVPQRQPQPRSTPASVPRNY